jgi:hypothetical protein
MFFHCARIKPPDAFLLLQGGVFGIFLQNSAKRYGMDVRKMTKRNPFLKNQHASQSGDSEASPK